MISTSFTRSWQHNRYSRTYWTLTIKIKGNYNCLKKKKNYYNIHQIQPQPSPYLWSNESNNTIILIRFNTFSLHTIWIKQRTTPLLNKKNQSLSEKYEFYLKKKIITDSNEIHMKIAFRSYTLNSERVNESVWPRLNKIVNTYVHWWNRLYTGYPHICQSAFLRELIRTFQLNSRTATQLYS